MIKSSGIGTPYFYEYELGLMECLDMLYNDSIEYVSFQDPRFQALDDVVVSKCGKLINIQIKHTSIEKNMTYSFFWGKDKDDKSLLKSLMNDWKENHEKYPIDEIRIYSNKNYGIQSRDGLVSFNDFISYVLPKIQEDYNYIGDDHKEKKTISIFKKRLEDCLGDKASLFVNLISFKLTDSLSCVISNVKNKIKEIIGTDDEKSINIAFNSLQSKLVYWTTELREDYRIYKEDVYSALDGDEYSYMYNFAPQTPIFPSRVSFATEIEEWLKLNDNIFFLQGNPGVGKTNFISYLCTKKNTLIDFRFYTYYPAEKCNNIYSDDYGMYQGKDLWISLLIQLRKYFKDNKLLYKYSFPIMFKYIDTIDLKRMTLKYLEIYKNITGRCNIVVDGIDHAARFNDDWNKTYLSELPDSSELPPGVKMLVVGQPDYEYPVHILNDSKKKSIPEISLDDIKVMLIDINNSKISKDSLASIIMKEVGTNTLNVLFSIKEITKLSDEFEFEDLIYVLHEKKLNSTINNYYEWIYNAFKNNQLLKQISLLMTYSTRKIKVNELCQIFELSTLQIHEAINSLYPLVIIDDNEECYVYHNDVKLFFKNKFITSKLYSTYVEDLLEKLTKDINLKHNVMVEMLAYTNLDLFEYYNLEYLKESFYYSIPIDFLLDEYKKVIVYFKKYKRFDKALVMNVFLSTIHQIDNIVRYNNEGDNFSFEIHTKYLLSEIYNYDINYEYEVIISDIYSCLCKKEYEHANYLYSKYFVNLNIKLLFEKIKEAQTVNEKIIGKLGYLCRFYNIELNQNDFDRFGYYFIEGWINCSKLYPESTKFNFSCMITYSYPQIVNDYIKDVMENDIANIYYDNVKIVIDIYNMDIYSRIKLFEKYRNNNELFYFKEHLEEIVPENNIFNDEYASFLKVIKYLAPIYNDFDVFDELHDKLCVKLRSGVGTRAYPITVKIYSSFKHLYQYLYNNKKYTIENVINIFDDVYFAAKQHGSGSAHDCGYYSASKVIYKMIFELCNKDCEIMRNIADHYLDINDCINTYIEWDIFPVYYFYKQKGLQFLQKWYLDEGYLWTYENNTFEFEGNLIVESLIKLGFDNEASKLALLLNYRKNIGFVGHKDYSLSTLYRWIKPFEHMSNECFIREYGAKLLSINDYASSNGDNRYCSTIEKAVLRIALNIGPVCFDAIYNMKNNPKDFYYWRTNASEVISHKCIDKYKALTELVKKWNLHEVISEMNNIEQWVTLMNESWTDFITQVNCFTKEEGIRSKNELILLLHDYIPHDKKELFYHGVIKKILNNRNKYGYEYDWSDRVIDKYYDFIPAEDYQIMLLSIINEVLNVNSFYNLQNDFDLLTRGIMLKKGMSEYIDCFDDIISMYEIWIGHPDFVNINKYSYKVDNCITTFKDFVNKQLCKKYGN